MVSSRFHKILFALALVIGLAGQPPLIGAESLTPQQAEDRLKDIFSSPGEKIDLAEALILVSSHWSESVDPVFLRAELDRLTESARRRLKDARSGKEIIDALRETIHSEGGYRYTDRVDAQGIPVNSEELFLHGLLKTRRGYCMNLSLLYLILGERLELPLYGVALPNHFFVRYDSGTERVNIEATESGAPYSDDFYMRRFGLVTGPATRFFTQNLDKRQTLGAYFSNVGMAHYRKNRVREAVFYLEASARINEQSVEAHNNLANIYTESKQFDQAIRHYKLALRSDPNNAATLFNLGLAWLENGDKQKALESFLQVTQIDPGFYLAHEYLARLYLDGKKYWDALLHFKKLDEIDPGKFETQVNLGKVYLRLGQYAMALDTLKRGDARFPGRSEILAGLAEAYYRMEQFDRAVEKYRYLIELAPESLQAYIQLGWTYYRKGETKLASMWTERGLKQGKGPDDLITLAHMNLGFYALLEKKYTKSRSEYQQALAAKDPGSVEAMIGDLREAAQQFPRRTDLVYFSGWICFEAGQPGRAESFLRQYLQTSPDGAFAGEARALLSRLKGIKAESVSGNTGPESVSDNSLKVPEGMAVVPQGFFIMGSEDHGEDESPEHKVYLDTFFIDKYEVTAKDFAEFLNNVNNVKGYYLDNKYGMLYYQERFYPRKGLESYPINNVKWEGARDHCKWKNKRLPTEAEWEKAARGVDGHIFPWGNHPPGHKTARYFQTWTEDVKHRVMAPVDSMPEGESPYGLHHMAGNVKEWVDDWFDREYYEETIDYANPKGPIGGEFKVLRGGSWRDLKGFIYSSFRNNSYPDTRLDDYGFRCAKSAAKDEAPKTLTRLGFPQLADHPNPSPARTGIEP